MVSDRGGSRPFELDVLMPYYGDPAHLLRAIASVQALQDADWRLTIVEDNHPEGATTERRVAELDDPRIRYLRNETNLGVAANTFRCLQLAERDHFVLLDFDDVLLPNYAIVVRDLLERHPDAAVVQPGIQVVDAEGLPCRPLPDRIKAAIGPVNRDIELRGEAAVASLLRGNWSYGPSLCYRRSRAQALRLRPGTDSVHDLARIVDLICDGGTFVVGSEIAFQYRRHRTSHSSTGARTGARFLDERRYFEVIGAELSARDWVRASRQARLRLFSRFNAVTQLPHAVRLRDRRLAATLLAHALR